MIEKIKNGVIDNKKVFKKIANIFLNILIFLFSLTLVLVIFINLKTKFTDSKHATFFGYSLFEVETGSMAKHIMPQDWVIVKLTKDVKLNDVITFESNQEFITHRVVGIYQDKYITKGDANKVKDEPVSSKQIVGKVVKIIPNVGIFRKVILNKMVLFSALLTVVIFNYILKTYKPVPKEERPIKEKKKPKLKKELTEVITVKDEDIDKINEDLEKTVTFKTVLIDDMEEEEVKEEPKEEVIEEKSTEEDTISDEESETVLFRMISVDESEIDETLLEIANTEMKEQKPVPVVKEEPKEEVEKEKPREPLVMPKKETKADNVLELLLTLKQEEIIEIVDLLNQDDLKYVINSKFKKDYSEHYVKGYYYNFYKGVPIKPVEKNITDKMLKVVKRLEKDLLKETKDDKEKTIIKKYSEYYNVVSHLEHANKTVKEDKVKQEFIKKTLAKNFKEWEEEKHPHMAEKILKVQNKYKDLYVYYFEEEGAPTFELDFFKVRTRKYMKVVKLAHNITFSKVFSDYIIDKTYNEGVVAEDKLEILITLLLKQLVNDIVNNKHDKKYYIDVPGSLYPKVKKTQRLFGLFDNEYAKDNVISCITYEDLNANHKIIKELKQLGYKFALILDTNAKLAVKDKTRIYLADYLFMTRKVKDNTPVSIINDYKGNIIYENIYKKLKEGESD